MVFFKILEKSQSKLQQNKAGMSLLSHTDP